MIQRPISSAVSALIAATVFAGFGAFLIPTAHAKSDPKAAAATNARRLDTTLIWYGNNRQRLDEMISRYGKSSRTYDRRRKPVAVFDWDNTVIRNDIGDATMFWLVKHGKILQPPQKDWSRTSPFLTTAASTYLHGACSALAEAGQPLPTDTNTACADAIANIYANGTMGDGTAAWAGHNPRQMEPGYAWLAHLLAGYTPSQVRTFASDAAEENLAAPVGTTQTVGTIAGLNGYIRIYDQIRDLIGTLQENGFDVWVLSASPQYVVEPVAARVGIMQDRVIGIRTVQAADVLTYDIKGCGPVRDGENTLITYVDGKRCWINTVIYGDNTPSALKKKVAAKRPVFAAGDSDTDMTFLQDATVLKLAINRNKQGLMCNAYHNSGGRWLVNPMFIRSMTKRADPYACSTTACRSADGKKVPCLDEDGKVIADQVDTVFEP